MQSNTKTFCLKLGTNTSEYEVVSRGNLMTIKKIVDIVRMKKELKMQTKLSAPKKITLGDYLQADPIACMEQAQSKNVIKSFADLDEAQGLAPEEWKDPSFIMASTEEFLEVKNHLVFRTFGHLDIFTVVEKGSGKFYLEMENQHGVLFNTAELFIQNNMSLDQETFETLTPTWIDDASKMFNVRRQSVRPLTIYFAGQCWTNKDLIGNMYLAESIHKKSNFRYRCVLPQNLYNLGETDLELKNNDLARIRDCDGIFLNFDGTDIDQKTVVEFTAAKFANKPAVIVRTDFRDGGDKPGYEPWNLMLHAWPRTDYCKMPKSVIQDYQDRLEELGETKGNICQVVA